MSRFHQTNREPQRSLAELLRERSGLTREVELVERAAAAYQRARREVYDAQHSESLQLSPRQREVLVEIQVAEDELRRFRAERVRRLLAGYGQAS